LPQKFASNFSQLGINIHDPRYLQWWSTSIHAGNSWAYNRAWKFFLAQPRTAGEVLNFARKLMRSYGLGVNF